MFESLVGEVQRLSQNDSDERLAEVRIIQEHLNFDDSNKCRLAADQPLESKLFDSQHRFSRG